MTPKSLIGGAVLAALWFVCGWMPHALYLAGGSLSTLAGLIPSPVRLVTFGAPIGWVILAQVLMAAGLVAGFASLTTLFSARRFPGRSPNRSPNHAAVSAGRSSFIAGWLAAILTAFAIGAVLDIGSFLTWVGDFGVRGAAGTMGAAAMSTWWGVLVGWIPALVSARTGAAVAPERADAGSRRAAGPTAIPNTTDTSTRGLSAAATTDTTTAGPRTRRSMMTAVAVIAAVALIGLPIASEAGDAAAQDELRTTQAEADAAAAAQADPDGAAAPDPSASGEPVPSAAAAEGTAPDDACTTANTTMMAPGPDGATGHRGQSLMLVNVGEEPCVLDGYPDVAYGDQNAHLLNVTVEHGGSFMAVDPGPAPITLQPGESASAVIGWDANSVHGQLAARSLWIAVYPGDARLSWDVSLDIIPGATVSVTAWQLSSLPAG